MKLSKHLKKHFPNHYQPRHRPPTTGELVRSFGKPCPYCGNYMGTGKRAFHPSRDHIIPKSRGYGFVFAVNKIICCTRCNEDKRDLTIWEWRNTLNGDRREPYVDIVISELAEKGLNSIEDFSMMVASRIEALEECVINAEVGTTIETVLDFCSDNGIDVIQAGEFIQKRPALLAKVVAEAINNRSIKSGTKLPI